ncbi:MAG: hypothetical protein DWQ45_08480 [Planctomycetota bacterium]|nr:MAG: hypothetical protein DWQ45_08480 [Planctomycetota bacterium]
MYDGRLVDGCANADSARKDSKGEAEMRQILKVAIAGYLLVVVGASAAFLIQQQVAYNDHIRPARKSRDPAFRAVVTPVGTEASIATQEVTIQFVDRSMIDAPARLGNEIEEHMMSLFGLNLATGVMVCVLCLTTLRFTRPPGDGVKPE